MFNSWLPESQDRLPLTWWKQHPVYLAAILALAGVASMVLTAVLGYGLMEHFVFTYASAFHQLHLWTPLTYVFVNPPSLWTLIGCLLLWNFGGRGFACMGITQLEFGVFIAFATLYPRAKLSVIILTIDAWVLAAVFVGLNALGSLGARDWSSLFLLAANVGTAYAFIRFETGALKLPSLPKRSPQASKPTKKSSTPTVDDILDKISHQGMQSLTAEERRILDKASDEMKRKR